MLGFTIQVHDCDLHQVHLWSLSTALLNASKHTDTHPHNPQTYIHLQTCRNIYIQTDVSTQIRTCSKVRAAKLSNSSSHYSGQPCSEGEGPPLQRPHLQRRQCTHNRTTEISTCREWDMEEHQARVSSVQAPWDRRPHTMQHATAVPLPLLGGN